MDIEFFWNNANYSADYKIVNNKLADEHDIKTAVIISLFTDRRAKDDDELPDSKGSKRGWWGDAFMSDPIGSRLWLLSRAKQTQANVIRAKDYAKEALQWLINEGVAESITVDAEIVAFGVLGLAVTVQRATKPPEVFKFNYAWLGITDVRN